MLKQARRSLFKNVLGSTPETKTTLYVYQLEFRLKKKNVLGARWWKKVGNTKQVQVSKVFLNEK